MRFIGLKTLKLGIALGALVALTPGVAEADALSTPAMAGPLAANPNPFSFNSGFGNIYVSGAISGIGFYQSNAQHLAPGDADSYLDLANAQIAVQKTDGLIQFYIQAGEYALPALGVSYLKSSSNTADTFGAVPVAYLKIAPTSSFSVEAGKLPALIGSEYNFTFENMNIERGLMWYQEPGVSRGVQANYAEGPFSVSVSLNDGYYSDRLNWLTGVASYAIDSENTITVSGGANLGSTDYATFTAPHNVNNGELFDLIYTYASAPWAINPYVQYQHVPASATLGLTDGTEWGFGVLASYSVTPEISVTGRAEYETSSGSDSLLLYGPKSKAWSLTLTPTWQHKLFFVREELSYTGLSDQSFGFGSGLDKDNQFRAVLEAGVVF